MMRTLISTPDQPWLAPPETLPLRKGEVHVWRGIVDIPSAALQVFETVLSPDERERAHRFRFPQHQQRFIAARGMLRSLISRYLHIQPEKIKLGLGPQGKPFVENTGRSPLYFNVSHSQKIAVFAFSPDFEVGIDVEGPQPRMDYHGVASRVLSNQEQQWIQDLPESRKKSALLTAWARKEAFVKAIGTGLAFPLRNLTVTLLPEQTPQLVHIDDPSLADKPWTIHALYPRSGYAAALVVAGHTETICLWDYRQPIHGIETR